MVRREGQHDDVLASPTPLRREVRESIGARASPTDAHRDRNLAVLRQYGVVEELHRSERVDVEHEVVSALPNEDVGRTDVDHGPLEVIVPDAGADVGEGLAVDADRRGGHGRAREGVRDRRYLESGPPPPRA